jgi:hypothetical protein
MRVPGGRRVLVVDRDAAARTWVWRGRVIIGPALVTPRGAELDRATTLTVPAADRFRSGRAGRSPMLRRTRFSGPPDRHTLRLPALRRWRFARESPEREPG